MPMPTPPLAHALSGATRCAQAYEFVSDARSNRHHSATTDPVCSVRRPVSFPGTLQKVRAAIEHTHALTHTHATHTRTSSLTPFSCAQTSTPRASTRCAVARDHPTQPPLTRACLRTGRRPPLLPRRGRCAPALPTRNARLQAHLRAPLPCADHPLVSAISENAEKLQCASAHAPRLPTLLVAHLHRACAGWARFRNACCTQTTALACMLTLALAPGR